MNLLNLEGYIIHCMGDLFSSWAIAGTLKKEIWRFRVGHAGKNLECIASGNRRNQSWG